MRTRALERMFSPVLPLAPRRFRGRNRKGRKRTLIPAAATLEALEPRLLLSVSSFDAVTDGNVSDTDLDGVFETVITNSQWIRHRWDSTGRQLGVYEFDLRNFAPGTQLESAVISFMVTGWTSDTGRNLAVADVYAFSGDGFVSANDATTPGVLVGSFTILPGGQQQHTLNADALEAFGGGLVTLRIATEFDGHAFDTAAIEDTAPPVQLFLDTSGDNTTFEVLADGFVADVERDGFFDLVDTAGQEIFARNYDFDQFGDPVGDQRGILEFDLRGIAAGRPIVSAKLGLDVSYLERVDDGITIHNPQFEFIGYSGDGSVTLADADRAGTVLGSGTAANFGYQEFTLDPDALEAQVGSIAGIRIQTTSFFGNGFATVSSETPFIAVTPKLIVEFGELPPPEPTTLSIAILADSIMENAGNDATTATVTRTGDLTNPLVVRLQTTGKITVPSTVTIPAGQASVMFGIDSRDDTLVGSDVLSTITARADVPGEEYSLDTTFSGDGSVPASTAFKAVAVYADGRIISAGSVQFGGVTNLSDLVLKRHLSNGSPDTTFDSDGTLQSDITGQADRPEAILVQPDGKIIVAGIGYNGPQFDFLLARYNDNGTLDSTFGVGGKVLIDMGPDSYNEIWDLALQSDGKIVAATHSDFGGRVVRYNSNGTLDTSFGIGGLSPFGMSGRAFGIAIQSDGKIVIVGENNGGNFDSTFALARYNSNGTLDTSIRGGGRVATNLPGRYEEARDVVIQPDGKIIVVGQVGAGTTFPPEYDVAVLRYNANGILDTTFGAGGMVVSDFGGADDIGVSLAVLPDGDIVVGGTGSSTVRSGVARYDSAGTLLSSDFTFPGSVGARVYDMAVQEDGKVILGTSSHLIRFSDLEILEASDSVLVINDDTNTPPTFADQVVSINENSANGTLVTTMTANDRNLGQTLTYAIVSGNESGAFALDAVTGQVTVADSTKLDFETTANFVLTLRATDNGTPVMSDDATLTVQLNDLADTPNPSLATISLSLAADSMSEVSGVTIGTVTRTGNLFSPMTVFLHSSDHSEVTVPASVTIAAGETTATFTVAAVGDSLVDGPQTVTITASTTATVPFYPEISLDTSFGVVSTSLQMHIQPPDAALAVQLDGKIVAAAQDTHTGSWRLTRINTDGTIDTSFGTNGVTVTPFGPEGIHPVPHDMVIDRHGRILVGGKITSTGLAALARYSADGTLDTGTGFGGGTGIANLDAVGGWVEDIIMLPDNDIMLAMSFNGGIHFRAVRLNYHGSFDTSFGSGGILNLTSVQDPAQSIEQLDNGQFLIAGGNSVARVHSSGVLDMNFGVGGVQTLTFGGASRVYIFDTQVMADGRILVAAEINNLDNNTSNFAAARLTAAGQMDISFSGDGWVVTDFSGFDDRATTMALQSDGKLLIGGYAEVVDFVRDVALVRYNLDGSLDTTFHADGRYTTSLIGSSSEQIFDMALQPDGNLAVLAGWGSDIRVARFNLAPRPQLLYAHDTVSVNDANQAPRLAVSIKTTEISENGGTATGSVIRFGDLSLPLVVALTSSDPSELTVPATVTIPAGQQNVIFPVTAVDDALLDGTITVTVTATAVFEEGQPLGLDTTFGTMGSTNTEMVVQTHLGQLAWQPDGKIIAVGQDLVSSDWRLTRFNADGTIDTTFGVGGSVTTSLGPDGTGSLGTYPVPQTVVVQPDGKILVGGENFTGSNFGAILVRYNADGSLDTTFGQGGIANVDPLGGAILAIIAEPDGKLMVAVEDSFRLARLNSDGTFDTSFGNQGIRNYFFDVGSNLNRMVKQPDGKYLLAGGRRIARVHADGSVDRTFGSSGAQLVNLGTHSSVTDLHLMDDGRILLGVQDYSNADNTYNFGAIRLTAEGQFDTSFDGDGKVSVDFAAVDDLQTAMAVQSDGRILLVGFTEIGVRVHDAAAVRLNLNGTLDTTFDGDGRYQTQLITGNHGFFDLLLDEQDRMVLIGGSGLDVNLYRFNTGVKSTLLQDSDSIDVTNDDTNAPPVIADQSFSLNENSANGTFVGTVLASDPDAGQTLSYAIIAGNHAMYSDRLTDPDPAFAIDSNGQITVADVQQIDFELDATWTLAVRVTDTFGASTDAIITINVNDLNEAPVVSSPSAAIVENHPLGETVLGVAASDPDGDTLSYSITGGNTGNVFSINPTTGKLSVINSGPLDFETHPGYTLTIRVTDNGSPQMFTDVAFPISLLNANESPVVTGGTTTLAEGAPNGTPVFTPTATDQDAGQILTFAITGGNTGGAFAINSATGAITVADSTLLDITTNPSFTLTVQATDNGSPTPLSGTASVVINLTDTNQAPVLNDQAFNIAENSGNGTIVGTIGATDPDAGQMLTFTLTGSSHPGVFAVSAAGAITVADGTLLDFETLSSVTLNVQVSDNGDPAIADAAVVTINLTNVNEAPTVAGGPSTIAENSSAGTPVGSVLGSDVDAGSTLSYSIIGGNIDGAFTINIATGQIAVANAAALNFEMTPLFNLTVQVSDGTLTGSSAVAVSLTDVNETPSLADAVFAVAENSAPGTVVGTVTGSDVDAGQALTYALTAGNIDGAFAINSSTGQITVANPAALDFEVNPVFALTVTATDNGTPILSDAAVVTINLSDVNEAPTIADASLSVAENSATGTVVGSLGGSDPDNGQTLTFSLTGSSLPGAFNVSAAGVVTVADQTLLNFESTPSVTLNVQVTDNGVPSLNDTAVVTINLTNVNEAPTVTGGPFTVAENSALGAAVGSVIGSDPDAGTALVYSITSGNIGGAFAIDASTGAITVGNPAALNFESTPTFILGVQVSDGTLNGATLVTVNLSNVNEAPTIADASFNLPENSAPGTSVGSVTASDPDNGQSLTYVITAGNTGGAFAINSSTGQITVANTAALDFETNPSFALTVSVTDNGTSSLNDAAVVTINLTNVNEAPTLNNATFAVAENSANGTAVGTVTGSDVDGPALTYSIIGGNGIGGGAFAINALTGAITVADSSQLNFESTTSFILDVHVSDGGSPALTDTAQVTINLSDVNEAPTLNDATFGIAENSASGTPVGTVTGTDADNGQSLTYVITAGNTGGAFAINSSTGQITVANAAALDFEINPSFAITVTATDNGSSTLNDAAVVTINLANLNEAPTVAGGTTSLPETSANGTTVFNVIAADPDAGQTLIFAITAGNESGAFAIDSTTGVITVANSSLLNNEVTPSYALTVQATDNGTPVALSGSAVVTVNITDVNKAPIVEDQSFSLNENAANGTVVGNIAANDPDTGQVLTYAISGPHSGAFAVSSSGVITVADSAQLNFESSPTFTFTVMVTDNGTPNLTDTAIVTINLNDVNEAPTVADASFGVAENSANGTIVGSLSGSDPDDGQTLTFSLTGSSLPGAFNVSAAGVVTVADQTLLNFESTPSVTLNVQVTDNGVPSLNDTAVVTINLTNVNEAPTVTGGPFTVAENSALGAAVGSVIGSDPDADTALVYSITSGNIGGAFAIDSAGLITVANSTALNFESTPTLILGVQVSDGTLNGATLVTVNLSNVNEAPTIADATFGLPENSANGTPIGTVTGTDPDNGQTLIYVIAAGNTGGAFAIDASTGAITVANAAALNFEANPAFALTVIATDSGSPSLNDAAVVTINLTNVNEVPTLNNATFAIAENSVNGTAVDSVTGSDVDGPALTYSIIGGNGTGGGAFAINALTGAITVADPSQLNFESTTSFVLDVQVSDGGSPSLTDTAQVTINLSDVNEAPTLNDATFGIAENSATGTPVGTVTGTDPDNGQMLTYVITAGNTGDTFAINRSTGQITVANAAALDFETNPSFALTVTATDDGSPALNDAAVVTINLANVNEAPTLNNATFAIAENSANGMTVGTLAAVDVDGPALTYSLMGGTGAFAINALTGAITVADGSQLNFESTTSFVLDVQVSDGGSPALIDTAQVTINVTNVNESPTLTSATFTTAENTANGTLIGLVSGVDPDAGQSLSYAITAGNTNGAFAIDAATGQIVVANATALNFEVTPTFNLTVQVTDNGVPAASGQATVTVNLTDVTDEGTPPVVADQAFSIDENSAAGSSVGTVLASPGEGGTAVVFEIIGGNESGAFAIHPVTGHISVLDASILDHETNPSFALTVKVTDSMDPTLFATASVAVNVNDLPEPVLDILHKGQGGDFVRLDHKAPLQVTLLSTADFDATEVDILSLRFGATGTEDSLLLRGKKKKPTYRLRDVNNDGLLDLIAQFDGSRTGLTLGDTQAKLTGSLLDGTQISAVQTIVVKSKPGK